MKMDFKKLSLSLIALAPVAVFAQQPGSDAAVEEFSNLLRDIHSQEAYNALRSRQLQNQQSDLADLQAAIDQVPELQLQLPPLLIRMVDGLAEFVEQDLPFLVEERQERVDTRYQMIDDTRMNDAQKLRRILEAWMIEVEYGSAFQTETGSVMIDGNERAVDFVILGRIGIMFQTSDDEALTGLWDHEAKNWVMLGSEHRNQVRQAIRMARSQIAPDLLLLPVLAAE